MQSSPTYIFTLLVLSVDIFFGRYLMHVFKLKIICSENIKYTGLVLIHSNAYALMSLKETAAENASQCFNYCRIIDLCICRFSFAEHNTVLWFLHRAFLSTWQKDGRSSRPLLCFSFWVWRKNLPILYQSSLSQIVVFIWRGLQRTMG